MKTLKLFVVVTSCFILLMNSCELCLSQNATAIRPQEAPINTDPVITIPSWYPNPTGMDLVYTTVVNDGEISTTGAHLKKTGCTPSVFVELDSYTSTLSKTTVDKKLILEIPAGESIDIPSPTGTPAALAAAPSGPFQWKPKAKTQFLQIDVDPSDCIYEYDETNNTASRSLPDLEPVELTVGGTSFGTYVVGAHEASPARGKQTYINLKIANRGQMPPTYYRIQWRDEQPAGTVLGGGPFNYMDPLTLSVPGVAQKTRRYGGKHFTLATYTFTTVGVHHVCVTLDAEPAGTNGYVPESNESNNELCMDVLVHEPLSELSARAWSGKQGFGDFRSSLRGDACYIENHTYDLYTHVYNVGEADTANPVDVRMQDTKTAVFSMTSPLPLSATIASGFPRGGRVDYVYDWTPQATGSHYLTFDVDLTAAGAGPGAEPEYLEEINNAIYKAIDVKPEGADLGITYVAPLACHDAGTGISPQVTVVNRFGDPVSARVEA